MYRTLVISLAVAAMLPFSAMAENSVTIAKQIPYSKDAEVPDAVAKECQLPEKISQFIQEYAKEDKKVDIKVVDSVSASTPGKVLVMEITNLEGTGGGAWSGAKFVTTKGILYENGKEIGSFKAKRRSGGGAFGGFKGTCSILGRCTKEIGKDVSEWLQSPTMNAKLGDS